MKGKRNEKSNGGLEIKLILVLCLEIKVNPGVVLKSKSKSVSPMDHWCHRNYTHQENCSQ